MRFLQKQFLQKTYQRLFYQKVYYIFKAAREKRLFPRDNQPRESFSESYFDQIYRLDSDPWGEGAESGYELCKADMLLKVVARRHHKNAMDIGCGSGNLTKRFATYCDHLLGLDISAEAISLAETLCKDDKHVSFVAGDIHHIEHNTKYDLFICAEVLYYLSAQDLDNLLEKIAELSTPDAWLVVLLPADNKYVNNYIFPSLKKRFKLVDQIEHNEQDRPFVISLMEVDPEYVQKS